jgi:hypothetical protein
MATVIVCDVLDCDSTHVVKRDAYGLDDGIPTGWAQLTLLEEVTVNGDVGLHTATVEINGHVGRVSGVSAPTPVKQKVRRQYALCSKHRLPSWKVEPDEAE